MEDKNSRPMKLREMIPYLRTGSRVRLIVYDKASDIDNAKSPLMSVQISQLANLYHAAYSGVVEAYLYTTDHGIACGTIGEDDRDMQDALVITGFMTRD